MDTNKSIVALEGNNGSRVYYADGTVEELPKEGEIYIKDEIATSAIHGTLNEVFCGDIQQQARAISVRIHGDLPPDLHGSIEPNSRETQRNYQETLFIYRRNSDRRKREEQQADKLANSFSDFYI